MLVYQHIDAVTVVKLNTKINVQSFKEYLCNYWSNKSIPYLMFQFVLPCVPDTDI